MIDSKLHPLAITGNADFSSGGLQGYCRTNYATLVALLGLPHTQNGDKTTVEWAFCCNNGCTFHVYDWKQSATPKTDYDWHIGGSTDQALAAFERFTGLETRSLFAPATAGDDQ
jgi:hypothetical protein